MKTVLISSLNQYVYCPKSAWLLFVAGERAESPHLLEGKMLHKRADSAEPSAPRKGVKQQRTVSLYSQQYGLSGIADVIEEVKGAVYPVEYKKGVDGDWLKDQVQLCAQALCIEEMRRLAAPIPFGYLYYAASKQRRKIALTKKLRAQTIQAIEAVRALLTTRHCPPVAFSEKCPECALYRVCLPQETERLKRAKPR
ncbi:hypothetical protein U14_02444 [Candidatus Moduliflexus flocculans]|uniref:CRISPR-associated exonuclease Cas4 n=1 Tax=Candidatus Moduliflexus flocculans TaxID=1499966 RepID=A0A081BLD5_9BACT|nr:hypothetical protein U14_02444 [Candidatus Moduliflexus flocculans]